MEGGGSEESARHARLALLGEELLLKDGIDRSPGELQVRDVDSLLGLEQRDGHVRRDIDQARVHAREHCRHAPSASSSGPWIAPHT